MEKINLWWGYQHINGDLKLKRYFDNQTVVEASKSPFVKKVVGPYEAESREEAARILRERTA